MKSVVLVDTPENSLAVVPRVSGAMDKSSSKVHSFGHWSKQMSNRTLGVGRSVSTVTVLVCESGACPIVCNEG